jgi:hypothetical protein
MNQINNLQPPKPDEAPHRGRPPKEKSDWQKQYHYQRLLGKLKNYYDICLSYYAPIQRKMKMLDATDSGDIWKALKTTFPSYQILPDTNMISYVKNNLTASIYSVGKAASIQPTSEDDKSIIVNLNIAMERIWDLSNVRYYEYLAGDRAALMNMGVTQVSWDDNNIKKYGSDLVRGNIKLKNIDPIKFMRDPFASSLETSGYCMTVDNYHKSWFEEQPLYKDAFYQFLAEHRGASTLAIPSNENTQQPTTPDKDYYTLVIFWLRENGRINEYHTINGEYMLYEKEDIHPNVFPFAILYCNEPAGKLVGNSECAKALANNIAYNLMQSIALTAEYKNQRPPKFISKMSGLNVQSFAKHGDEANKTFVVNTMPDKAVYYHQFPSPSPNINNLMLGLQNGIETTTGVDGRYTGRNTGSILTTGGMEQMLNRVTVIDTPKITQYEAYAKQLTSLILYNFLQFSSSRKYFYRKPNSTQWESIVVPFDKLDKEATFDYSIDISSELPRTKERLAQTANEIMEKQMQYAQEGQSVNLITQEEWLMYQDLPNKEYMLERMGVERMSNKVEEVAQTLFQYANLVKNGMTPDDAIMATAQALQKQSQGQPLPQPEPGVNLATQSLGT